MRILCVEDEHADAQLVERYAKLTNHELILTANLEDARAALKSEPDLILVDLVINQARSGYLFIQELRENGYNQPIIAITGLALPQDLQYCYSVGATAVLTKPYAINELAEIFDKYAI
jgi:CheY-like chemotaxis protein